MKNTKITKNFQKTLGAGVASLMLLSAIPTMSMAATQEAQCCSINDRHNYSVTTNKTSSWDNHSIVEITIKNNDVEDWYNWSFILQTPYDIENIWNGTVAQHDSDGNYIIKSAGWNNKIAKGSSVTFGIIFSSPTDKKVELSNDWYYLIASNNNNTMDGDILPKPLCEDNNHNGRKDIYDLLENSSYTGYIPAVPDAGKYLKLSYNNVFINSNGELQATFNVTVDKTLAGNRQFITLFDDVGREVGYFADDGDLATSGDRVAGDGIYSVKYATSNMGINKLHAESDHKYSNYIEFSADAINTVLPDDNSVINISYENLALDVFHVGATATIHATVNGDVTGPLKLYDIDGNLLDFLVDSGDMPYGGDAVANDGIYSIRVSLKKKGMNSIYVAMGDEKSNILTLSLDPVAPKTQAEDDDLLTIVEIIRDQRKYANDHDYSREKEIEFLAATLNRLGETPTYINQVPAIKKDTITFDGDSTFYAETYFGLTITFTI